MAEAVFRGHERGHGAHAQIGSFCGGVYMIFLKVLAVVLGLAFLLFGYFIYFKKKYNLINGFEADFKAG
ncbi:MAG: hypothetical protein PUD68_12060, partial [Clostridiales bacterium]|nr:hypothetical protein [Clostridiales bacterium]